jgi:hypothetical protein
MLASQMKTLLTCFSGAALMAALPCLTSAQGHSDDHGGRPEILVHMPNPYAGHPDVFSHSAGRGGGGSKPIRYFGGPVMLGGVNVYVIWYGNWPDTSAAKTIATAFLHSIGGSKYYNINTTYYDGSGAHVANAVHFLQSVNDNYSQGQGVTLSDASIQAIVTLALNNGAASLPTDPNGVYFVLTSSDVQKSGFCTSYCGWHTHATINGADIKYAFVGNPAQCPSACTAQPTLSPNGDIGGDGMVSIIAHELEESNTDPDLNAWFDVSGQENADKCAWTFGATYPVSNGSRANMNLGGKDYLIQQNWVNSGSGFCALSY